MNHYRYRGSVTRALLLDQIHLLQVHVCHSVPGELRFVIVYSLLACVRSQQIPGIELHVVILHYYIIITFFIELLF